MKNDILFIVATHGDEPIGIEVLGELREQGLGFDWIVGNQPALDKNVRFIDADLNRSAPGDATSKIFEERRAAEIIETSKQYKYTIDIHGSSKDNGIFIIITNPTVENLKLASMLDINNIVIWPSITKEQTGPLSEYFDCGLEIECGKKDDPEIKKRLKNILTRFLAEDVSTEDGWQDRLKQKRFFKMYGSLKRSECENPETLKEFAEVTIKNEAFYSIFVGSYDYDEVLCYKLRLVDPTQVALLE